MGIEERVTKLELLNDVHLKKMIEKLESLSSLELEAKEAKAFRDTFDSMVSRIIDNRLNNIEFDKAIKETIDNEVKVILRSEESIENFTNRVEAIVVRKNKESLLKVYITITGVVTTIATGLVLAILKGLL